MNYQVFARKYRPKTFDDVLGQDHVVRTLKNAITRNRLAHAYLFVGPRGTGKTSTSRIFAKALNCTGGPKVDFDPDEEICVEIAEGRSLDVTEIDGASNNSVDDVRKIRETVNFAPARGNFRIFYIDEVHMLTQQAFNALLKTLEEPPGHVKFIFATTEAHRILPTILSRCQRFDLRRIPAPIIADHLLHIAGLEGVRLDPRAAYAIATGADGGMRDAQSMLDQLVAFCGNEVTEQDVLHIFGFTSHETVASLAGSVLGGRTAEALERVYQESESGRDLSRLVADLIFHFRNLLVHRVDPAIAARDLPKEHVEALAAQAAMTTNERLMQLIDLFAEVEAGMRWAANKRLYFEIGLIRAVQLLNEVSLSDVVLALRGALGGPPGQAEPPPAQPGAQPATSPSPSAGSLREAVRTSLKSPPEREREPESPSPQPARPAETAAEPVQDGEALWEAARRDFSAKYPLQAGFAAACVYLGMDGSKLRLGVAPTDRMAAESISRPTPRAALEEVLARHSGMRVTFSVEVRDDIVPPEPELPEPVEETAPPAPAEPPADLQETSPQMPPAPDPKSIDEEFRNDPLIREALRIFEARISSGS